MNPKLLFTLFILFSSFFYQPTNTDCPDAYTSASYGLSHSKKAFNAHNFDHQKYYAGRALEALEKTRDLVAECGCERAIEPVEIGIETLEEAMDPTDWKMGRYYSKKAIEKIYGILENLDLCSMDGETSANNQNDNIDNSTNTAVDEELIEFEQSTRDQIVQLNEKITELSLLLGCDHAAQLIPEQSNIELPEGVKFGSVEEAQEYYRAISIEAYQQAVAALQKCTDKE